MNTLAVESVGLKIRLLINVLSSSSLASKLAASVSLYNIPRAQNIHVILGNLV